MSVLFKNEKNLLTKDASYLKIVCHCKRQKKINEKKEKTKNEKKSNNNNKYFFSLLLFNIEKFIFCQKNIFGKS